MATECYAKGDNLSYNRGDNSQYLVITADDYGYSAERDRGIIKCFKESAISTASLLVNGLHAKEAADWAKQEGLLLGLHLNLTEGVPMTDLETCSSLINTEGLFLGKFGFRQKISEKKIDLSELRSEIENQIKRFEELLGYLPYHVDGHQHVHVIPGVAEVFAKVLYNKAIKVTRLPRERCIQDCDWLEPEKMTFYKKVVSQTTACQQIFQNYDLWFTDAFSGLSTCSSDMTLPRLKRTLDIAFSQSTEMTNKNQTKLHKVSIATNHTSQLIRTCELMVHPGYCAGNSGGCGAGPDAFSQSKAREFEMNTLLSEGFQRFLTDRKISLRGFKDIFCH